jgi:excisionase family DNA binding protein
MASELAVGFAVAKELMAQSNLAGGTPPPLPGAPAAAAAAANPDVLDPATVARMLGVSEADVMAEIEGGTLPAKKIGSSYRVTRTSLDAFLAQ